MVDNPLIERIKVFDHSDSKKNQTRKKREKSEFLPIDKGKRQLHSWQKISNQTDFIGQKEKSIDNEKMSKYSQKAKIPHLQIQKLKVS